jgi:hypothetical protein
LRVVRRFGAAASAAFVPAGSVPAASAAVSAVPAVAVLARVVLRFGVAAGEASSPPGESAFRRGALRFGASPMTSGEVAPSDAATGAVSAFRRVVRRFVAGSSVAAAGCGEAAEKDAAGSVPLAWRRAGGDALGD